MYCEIVLQGRLEIEEFVLQYKNCIATVEQGQGWTVLQYSGQPSHDTAGRAGSRLGVGRWACWRWVRRQGARGVRAGRAGRARQAGMRGTRGRGAQVSGTAWASGALAGARACDRASRRAGVGDSDARGRAAGASRGALGCRLGGLCASGVHS